MLGTYLAWRFHVLVWMKFRRMLLVISALSRNSLSRLSWQRCNLLVSSILQYVFELSLPFLIVQSFTWINGKLPSTACSNSSHDSRSRAGLFQFSKPQITVFSVLAGEKKGLPIVRDHDAWAWECHLLPAKHHHMRDHMNGRDEQTRPPPSCHSLRLFTTPSNVCMYDRATH